jgi:hypothetical protein
LLREVGNKLELALLLCRRGLVDVTAGDIALARGALVEAEATAVEMNVGSDSELHHEIEKLRQALSTSPPA